MGHIVFGVDSALVSVWADPRAFPKGAVTPHGRCRPYGPRSSSTRARRCRRAGVRARLRRLLAWVARSARREARPRIACRPHGRVLASRDMQPKRAGDAGTHSRWRPGARSLARTIEEATKLVACAALTRDPIGEYEWAADYHPACWERIVEVIRMAQEFEGPLASIAVDSPQRIAASTRRGTTVGASPDGASLARTGSYRPASSPSPDNTPTGFLGSCQGGSHELPSAAQVIAGISPTCDPAAIVQTARIGKPHRAAKNHMPSPAPARP